MLRDIRKKIVDLTDWIKAIKEELSKPRAPDLADLLIAYYNARNDGAWRRNVRIGNLKDFAEAINFLTEKGIATLEDLEVHLASHSDQTEAVYTSMKAISVQKKKVEDLLHYADLYRETKPIYDEWKGIKWKSKREKFNMEHERDLKMFHMCLIHSLWRFGSGRRSPRCLLRRWVYWRTGNFSGQLRRA